MKKFIAASAFIFIVIGAIGQKVGINTALPQATLDVRGSQRFGGINNFIQYDSATGKIEWVGASLFVPISQQIIKHSASGEGLYAGGGKLEYRNITAPVFFSDWTNGNGYFKGNLGIGTITPQHQLHLFNGASGTSSPYGSEMLGLESNGNINMAFLTPDAGQSTIWFSKPSKPIGGGIFYNNPVAPDGFVFRTNNIPSMSISNAGQVGIGVNSASSKLQVYGVESTPDGNAAAIEISNGATGSGFNNWFFRAGATGTTTPAGGFSLADNNGYRLVIDNTGKTGIGTTSPTATLDLNGNLGDKLNIWSGGAYRYGFGVVSGLFQIYAATSSDDIAFGSGNSSSLNEVMRVKGNGNVGIGTNNPFSKLHVFGGSSGSASSFSPLVVESNTNTYINMLSPNNNETSILFGKAENPASGGIIYNNSTNLNGFQFRVNGNQTVGTINNAGNWGLGMGASSSQRLTIAQTPANSDALVIYKLNSSGNGVAHWEIGYSITDRLYFTSHSIPVAYIDDVTGYWTAISDQSLKKDIQPLESVLPKLMQAQPVSYHMKNQSGDDLSFGFLAQELQKIFPDAVKTFDKGNIESLGISYTHLIPIAIAAIQEQQHIIQNQQLQIDELKKLVEQMLKREK